MKIIIREPFFWTMKMGVSMDGTYTDDQIIEKIRKILLENSLIAESIEIERNKIKTVDNFRDAEEFL